MCVAQTAMAGEAAGKGQHGVFRCQGSAVAVTCRVHMGEGEHPAASQSCGSPREPPGGVEYGRNIITTGFSEWGLELRV